MGPDPAADVFAFLTKPDWPTPVYWFLVIASFAIAVCAWRHDPVQRNAATIGRFVLRVIVGTMWWQQSLWKIPPNFDGLRFWMQAMVDHGSVPLQSQLVAAYVIPNIIFFGPVVYAIEVAVAFSLIIGLFSRWGAALGAAMAVNLWLGLYSAPDEWPWTYGFLVVIQAAYFIDPPGRSLGFDALWRSHARTSGWHAALT